MFYATVMNILVFSFRNIVQRKPFSKSDKWLHNKLQG